MAIPSTVLDACSRRVPIHRSIQTLLLHILSYLCIYHLRHHDNSTPTPDRSVQSIEYNNNNNNNSSSSTNHNINYSNTSNRSAKQRSMGASKAPPSVRHPALLRLLRMALVLSLPTSSTALQQILQHSSIAQLHPLLQPQRHSHPVLPSSTIRRLIPIKNHYHTTISSSKHQRLIQSESRPTSPQTLSPTLPYSPVLTPPSHPLPPLPSSPNYLYQPRSLQPPYHQPFISWILFFIITHSYILLPPSSVTTSTSH
jgi:hypothetical protein